MNYGATIALAAAFAGGWGVNGWRLDASYQAEAKTRVEAAARDRDAAIADRDILAGKLATSNDDHIKQLKEAKNETNRVRDAVRSGDNGLRVRVVYPTCPTRTDPAPSVDTGTGARLDAAAESAYFALRDGIDQASSQLAACQAELRLRVISHSPR